MSGRRARIVAAALAIAAPASVTCAHRASATPWPPCTLAHQAEFFERLEDMPAPIRADVHRRLGDIAGPGEAFNSTDVVSDDTPNRRFLRGVRSGNSWFVWYEHGGVGLHRHVLAYGIGVTGIPPKSTAGGPALRKSRRRHMPRDRCGPRRSVRGRRLLRGQPAGSPLLRTLTVARRKLADLITSACRARHRLAKGHQWPT